MDFGNSFKISTKLRTFKAFGWSVYISKTAQVRPETVSDGFAVCQLLASLQSNRVAHSILIFSMEYEKNIRQLQASNVGVQEVVDNTANSNASLVWCGLVSFLAPAVAYKKLAAATE